MIALQITSFISYPTNHIRQNKTKKTQLKKFPYAFYVGELKMGLRPIDFDYST